MKKPTVEHPEPKAQTGTPRASPTVSVRSVTRSDGREQAFEIRRRVFQEEQGVSSADEFDDDDERATHVLATVGQVPVGTGRIVFFPDYAKVGRMAVSKEWRRRGVGRLILEALTRVAVEQGVRHLVLHAQVHALPFYAAQGFQVVSDEFQEAGIPHRRMERWLP